MRKLTEEHKLAITELVFKDTANYIRIYCTDNTDTGGTGMCCDDIMHNINALNEFSKDNSVRKLHYAIMSQDTLVREHYISVLRYIENNNLIDANSFCCI